MTVIISFYITAVKYFIEENKIYDDSILDLSDPWNIGYDLLL